MLRSARLILAILALAALPARATHPIQPPAPEFPADGAWVNAKPLTLRQLRGRRVVLTAFINTANLNSLRAIQTLQRWWRAYSLNGLMIVGVHTPLYGFQRDPGYLRQAFKTLGAEFPVALDNERQIWKSYANEGWPSFYLLDHKGKIIYDQVGEAKYTELEKEIRLALEGLGFDRLPEELVASDPPTAECGAVTPETPVVSDRRVINLDKADRSVIDTNMLMSNREGELSQRGQWHFETGSARLDERNPDYSSYFRVLYRGAQAFALLAPSSVRPTRFFVRQDDLWLHSGNAGADILFDDDGRSYVEVSETRAYRLTQNPNDNMHVLALLPARPGAGVFSFSFADQCLKYEP